MSRIVDCFSAVCEQYPERDALVFAQKGATSSLTFAELDTQVARACRYLSGMGVKPGSRILAFAPADQKLCCFMMAVMKLGASVMYVDIFARQEKLQKCFEQYRPDFCVVSKKTQGIRFLFREIRKIKAVLSVDFADGMIKPSASARYIPAEDDIALLTMTTGSTGSPKIIPRTHHDLYEQLMLTNRNLPETFDAEVVLTTSYMYAFSNILNGYTTVLPKLNLGKDSSSTVNRKLSVFREVPVSVIFTTPDFCMKADNVFPELKKIYVGGAILTIGEASLIEERYRNGEPEIIYGATECNLICMNRLAEYVRTLQTTQESCLGHVVSGVSLRTDEHNEIKVTSDALLGPCLNATAFDEEVSNGNGVTVWHKTGDAGELREGALYYYGRVSRRVAGEEGLFCSQVEQRICVMFPSVEKCGLISQDDQTALFVQGQLSSKDEHEVQEFIEDQLQRDATIIRIKKIPCDVKHHTKINYLKLEAILKKRG